MSNIEAMDCTEEAVGWRSIPPEIKRNIITYLAFPDKQNMMLANWECSRICETIPNKLSELGITEFPTTAKTTLVMKWKNENGRLVSKMVEYRGREMRHQDCPDHTSQAMNAFVRLWRRSKIKTVLIEIPCFEGLSYLWEHQNYHTDSHVAVKVFNIRTNDYRLVEFALRSAKNSKQDISLMANDHGGMETAIFDLEKIKKANSVILWSLISNIQDHQLTALSAQNIRVSSQFLTSSSIVKILRDWKSGKRKLERLHVSSPLLDLADIVNQIGCTCWKNMTDICQVIWREVDEEGYTFATKGPKFDTPGAVGLIMSEGTPTFIFRIIKMTPSMSRLVSERCGSNCAEVRPQYIEQASN
ncbi:unnamed protein product [Caenorhabditis angaria]|uniref:F-box domain-containing protein n=1 Tax=Caenorhabditis angaria TaxID=860376 RepID=A0A9P1I3A9_9PELO|nr:unnamed protein product [Caenorhabditis angaria]